MDEKKLCSVILDGRVIGKINPESIQFKSREPTEQEKAWALQRDIQVIRKEEQELEDKALQKKWQEEDDAEWFERQWREDLDAFYNKEES